MGIYINMEIPKEGTVIVIDSTGQVWSNEWPTRGYTRLDGVTAITVPPHGRLIDADALMELYADTDDLRLKDMKVPIAVIRQNIMDMPTIIPASEEGE